MYKKIKLLILNRNKINLINGNKLVQKIEIIIVEFKKKFRHGYEG